MKIIPITHERIIEPCTLEYYNYEITPYFGCEHNCYYCYAQNKSEVDWENEVGIHKNLDIRLQEELSLLEPQVIYIAGDSDPYQPAEKGYKQTRKILELLVERNFSVSILTKSNLVIRDIDLLRNMHDASVGISIAFQDDSIRKLFEENTIPIDDRINALTKLKEEGLETYVLICPVMPFITDVEILINKVYDFADTIWIYRLEMKSERDKNWQKIKPILEQSFPSIFNKFREIVFSSQHTYWKQLNKKLENIRIKEKIDLEIHV